MEKRTATKTDYKKVLKHLYRPSAGKVVSVDVPEMNYLMIDGKGEPGSALYADAVEALFSVSYTIKFMIRNGDLNIDFGVLPLEGLWWADDMSDFVNGKKSNWYWKMMIMQPDIVTTSMSEAPPGFQRVPGPDACCDPCGKKPVGRPGGSFRVGWSEAALSLGTQHPGERVSGRPAAEPQRRTG